MAEDGYLTLHFATVFGNGAQHKLNLVHRDDVNTPYYFTLYHDAQGDFTGLEQDGIVAFKLYDLPALQEIDQPVHITLEWNTRLGTQSAKFKYTPRK